VLRGSKVHYAWTVVGVTFLVLLVATGVRSTPGILIVPLEDEFHWSRATISFAIGVNILLFGLVGPFAAAVMERLGVRRAMTAALFFIAAGVALTPLMRHAWQLLLLWGVMVGLGTGVTGSFLGATITERWFVRRRGFVVGLLTASAAGGQLVFLPPMAAIISLYGWRPMSLTLAAATLATIPVVLLLMRDRPEDVGVARYGEVGRPPQQAAKGNPLAIAFGDLWDGMCRRDFWLLSGSFFICGASTNGLIATHLVPACVDHGIAEVTGANLLAAMGIFNFAGSMLSGWLSDRVDNRLLLAAYYGLRGLSLMYLPFAFDVSLYGLTVFSLFYGLDWIASVPPTVRLTANAFGTARAGVMFAWITAIHQLGGALAAYLGGLMRVGFGTYLEAFMLSGLLCLGAALMALLIGRGRAEPVPAALPAE
jgi:sugar phosphate permease